MNCYVPMLEKLKAAVINKEATNTNGAKAIQHNASSIVTANDIQRIYPNEILTEDSNLPKRDPKGLTFTQNVGIFPRQVSLEIRHAHPSLGLTEVAHERKHSENRNVQCLNYKPPKGVLSLGLPPQMVPRGFSNTMAKKPPPQSATSEAICHYYETLNPKYSNVMSNPKYSNVVSMQRQKVYDVRFVNKKKSMKIILSVTNSRTLIIINQLIT